MTDIFLAPLTANSGSAATATKATNSSSSVALPTALATAAGSLFVGALLSYSLLRKRLLARDSPPSLPSRDASTIAHFQRLCDEQDQRRARRVAASASATVAAPAAASLGAGSAPLDLGGLEFRVPVASEAEAVTTQTVEAFDRFNASVGLGVEFSSPAFALEVIKGCIQNDQSLIAVRKDAKDGKDEVMGSVFVDEIDIEGGAVGCGPWSARWGDLNSGVGGELVRRIVSQSLRHGARSMRLIQIGANNTSFALYSSLGFHVREPLMAWKGMLRPDFIAAELALAREQGFLVRQLTLDDVAAANKLHEECNGISRLKSLHNDVQGAYMPSAVLVVVSSKAPKGKLLGYSTGAGAIHHAVATSLPALKALYAAQHEQLHLAAAEARAAGKTVQNAYQHTCIRLYPELTRWLISGGMRAYRQVNLMVLGEWQPIACDRFVYSPSIMY